MKKQIEEFINAELENLSNFTEPTQYENLEDEIYRLVLSKKFRKYAVDVENKKKIMDSIKDRVSKNEPLDIICLQGCFKLWRLDESPEADWGELFALIRLVSWIKPILAIYKPGAVVDFFVDDLIMIKICNYTHEEILAYEKSFQAVMDFVLKFAPSNLEIKITPTSTRYSGKFWEKLDVAVSKFTKPQDIKLTEAQIATIELNYRPIPGKKLDKLWHQKNAQVHDAYITMDDRKTYRNRPNAFLLFCFYHNGWKGLQIGSTKDSVAKFWAGVGALKPRDESFLPTVLSPSQLENAKFDWHDVNIKGLEGKNFNRIRLLK